MLLVLFIGTTHWDDTHDWKTSLQFTTLYAKLELFFPICITSQFIHTDFYLPLILPTSHSLMWDPSLQSVLVSARSFSAICFGFNSLDNLLEAATFFQFSFLRSFTICWATDTLAAHTSCESTPLVPYTVKTIYLFLPFVFYPLANYLSIETLAPYLMTAKFSRSLWWGTCWMPFQIKVDNTRISPWLLCRTAVICETQLLLTETTLTLLQHNIFIFVFTNPILRCCFIQMVC